MESDIIEIHFNFYFFYRVLQDQTEKAMMNQQNRLSNTAQQLGQAESRLSMIDSSRDQAYQETHDLKAEISVLKSLNLAMDTEKDQITVGFFFLRKRNSY